MAKIIKKAQNGKVIDKTSVSRPKRKPDTVATKPNYTYLKSSKKDQSPTSQDSINYKRGFNKGKKDKQSLFMSSDMNSYMGSVEGSRNTEKSKKLKSGGMIKRADGSMSKRGLWDNIRANKGSGKKPTASMLKQEKKIKSKAKK